tara:strand:+ start:180 stop:968 length:789 start_codon:yes stop_codon:yes gene_type:complete
MSEKNYFEIHGIKSVSPTQINKFRRSPARWLTNVAGYSEPLYKPAFTFGNAIEQGITQAVMGETNFNSCVQKAMEEFDIVKKIKPDNYDWDLHASKQDRVISVLNEIIPLYKKIGKPQEAQLDVTYQFENSPVLLKGRIDFLYEDYVRDLKTCAKRPLDVSEDYCLQLAFYSLATNKTPVVDYVYVTTKLQELISFDINDVQKHIKDIERIVAKMERLLSLSDDIKEVCYLSCLEPNLSNDNFYDFWTPTEIEGAKKLFDIK